jgi:hypothetical protein
MHHATSPTARRALRPALLPEPRDHPMRAGDGTIGRVQPEGAYPVGWQLGLDTITAHPLRIGSSQIPSLKCWHTAPIVSS